MKRTLLIILAVIALFSVSAYAFGIGTPTAAPTQVITGGDTPPADNLGVVFTDLILPDGSKVLSIIVQIEDETAVTAAADTPSIMATLESEDAPVKVSDYVYVYYDEVAKGGKKLASKTFDVAAATWTNLTVPGAQSGGMGFVPAGETFEVGSYTIAITEFKLDKEYDDSEIVSVLFSFTNNSQEATSAGMAIDVMAFQEGVELDGAYSANDPGNSYKEIKPGATINNVMASFKPTGTGPVSLEFTEWTDWEGTTLVEVVYDYPVE
jgi:hypothetical protein